MQPIIYGTRLKAGKFLDISNEDVITTTYSAGDGITIDENGVITAEGGSGDYLTEARADEKYQQISSLETSVSDLGFAKQSDVDLSLETKANASELSNYIRYSEEYNFPNIVGDTAIKSVSTVYSDGSEIKVTEQDITSRVYDDYSNRDMITTTYQTPMLISLNGHSDGVMVEPDKTSSFLTVGNNHFHDDVEAVFIGTVTGNGNHEEEKYNPSIFVEPAGAYYVKDRSTSAENKYGNPYILPQPEEELATIGDINGKQDKLIAGDGITIAADGKTISATGGGGGSGTSVTTFPTSIILAKRLYKTDTGVKLFWQDPDDTVINGFTLASWKETVIVKKNGSYPTSPTDGTVVVTNNVRNQYAHEPYEDTQENPSEWFYKAFPKSTNDVYCLNDKNNFPNKEIVVYGYRINEIESDPSNRVEYLSDCDNASFEPCLMDFESDRFNWGSWEDVFFIPKPCALRYDGTVDYYLDPTDFTKTVGGSESNVSNTEYGGNFMMEFPTIYTKFEKQNDYLYVYISNSKIDDTYECWSCKKSDGSYAEHFYLPMFEGTTVSGKMRSLATDGYPTASTTAETEATNAAANGTGWNTTLWADELLMWLLFPLLFKSTNSQGTLGYGATYSSSSLTCKNNSSLTKGLMYGTREGSEYGITYLGLHNWWAHRYRRPNGLMTKNGKVFVKMTPSQIDGSTTQSFNRTGEGYIETNFTMSGISGKFISVMTPDEKYGIFPSGNGTDSTYYCDKYWFNNSGVNQLYLGGAVDYGSDAGLFGFYVGNAPSFSFLNYGASLSYHS